jgi:uncharacterized protein with von Willebrand factor type A (vWA) domain
MVFGTINSAKDAAEKRMNEIEKKIIENKTSLDIEINNLKNSINDRTLEKRVEELEKSVGKPGSRSPKP